MAVLVIGGSGKDIGKTALVCAVISALREFDWTAVKITAHDYSPAQSVAASPASLIREETSPGTETDTARYLAAGARKALLLTRIGSEVPTETIAKLIRTDRNLIFESNRIVDALKSDVCLALFGTREPKPSFERLLKVADAIITVTGSCPASLPDGIPRFTLDSLDPLPSELVSWIKQRLTQPATSAPAN